LINKNNLYHFLVLRL